MQGTGTDNVSCFDKAVTWIDIFRVAGESNMPVLSTWSNLGSLNDDGCTGCINYKGSLVDSWENVKEVRALFIIHMDPVCMNCWVIKTWAQ